MVSGGELPGATVPGDTVPGDTVPGDTAPGDIVAGASTFGVDAAPAYPSHREADIVLRDGGTAHLRPIRPEDAPGVLAFHARQSPESIYFRFFAPMPRLPAKDLHRFTHVDHVDRVAFVCTVGDEIVGIGRYDRVDPTTAEVAFNIRDDHHGRGLGSVILEHLAAAARENGVRRFVADVLPQNTKMLAVFSDAGYEVRHRLEDGVLSLGFDIDPTERLLAVMEAREHRAELVSVQALFNPARVAVVGASRRPGTIGNRLLADILAGGFTGGLDLVHPEADAVLGVRAHRRLDDLSERPDLVLIAVPAESVLDVVRDCARRRVRGLVVVSGGFAETGAEGLARQHELVRLARANGMRLVGPNSWGIINTDPAVRLNVSLAATLPRPGRLGLYCQSGAMSVSVLDSAVRRGLGMSTFLSAGNRADVSGNDCMQYWEEDDRTDVIALYLESTGNPRKFSRIARRLARRKPVIVVKSGTSSFGTPPGHAVRAARVPREAFDAMLRQSGCVRVGNVHQLFDVAQLLMHQPLPSGPEVAVVANSDALAALIADACTGRGLDVVDGPVALPAQAGAEEFREALVAVLADDRVNSVVTGFIPPLAGEAESVLLALTEAAADATVPVVACLLDLPAGVHCESGGGRAIPTYRTPEEAVRALAAVTGYASWRDRHPGTKVDPAGCDPARARGLVTSWLERSPEGRGLTCREAMDLLACYGIALWPSVRVADPDHAVEAAEELGWPVVVKPTAPQLVHRADLGGVRLDLRNADQLRGEVARLRERLAPIGGGDLAVQRMAPAGVACVVRCGEDPLFGPVVSFGLGGDASDLLGDVSHRIPPLTDVDVADLVRSVRAAPKLFGHRGAALVDVPALEDVVARVSRLGDDLPEVAELELNPVVVAEEGAAVLGAVVRIAPDPHRSDAGRRELTAG
ncbi:MAG: GNAT family N-acetyltransferase [Actinomycetales bacterium]|nr:GNAT family N-acetyltransferase [Actinomycetales bacterium]